MATATAEINPQVTTIRGRLSWPNFTYAQALKQNTTSTYPKKEEDVKPSFNLLLSQAQADKLVSFIKDTFLPWCVQNEKDGAKSALTAGQVKKMTRALDEADWETEGVLGLINKVHEKTAELAPEAVMSVKVNGFKGSDLELKAVVKAEDELRNPTEDLIIPARGLILPIGDTTHELYPGSMVAAQINMFAFVSAGNPGITASTSTAIFVGHAERFGGGGTLDEDDIFMAMEDIDA